MAQAQNDPMLESYQDERIALSKPIERKRSSMHSLFRRKVSTKFSKDARIPFLSIYEIKVS